MLKGLADVLRQVFWLKKSTSKRRPSRAVKKIPKNKVTKKTKAAPKKLLIDPNLKQTGEITHYFDRIKVGVVKITQGTILIGDRLTIKTKAGVFTQKVWSMQVESQDVKVAKKGQLIGLKIEKPVAAGDVVYK